MSEMLHVASRPLLVECKALACVYDFSGIRGYTSTIKKQGCNVLAVLGRVWPVSPCHYCRRAEQ
jgi:hypothetical protein